MDGFPDFFLDLYARRDNKCDSGGTNALQCIIENHYYLVGRYLYDLRASSSDDLKWLQLCIKVMILNYSQHWYRVYICEHKSVCLLILCSKACACGQAIVEDKKRDKSALLLNKLLDFWQIRHGP